MEQHTAATDRKPQGRRYRRGAGLVAAAVLAAALSAFSALGYGESLESDSETARAATAAQAHSAGRPSVPVGVFVEAHHLGRRVPPGFLGLSFEVSRLREIGQYAGSGNFIKLLRSLGTGVLRFGGVSADTRVAWSDPATPPPAWASALLTAADLRRVTKVASSSGWRVLLTIGFGHFEPAAASHEALAARAALGKMLAGIELGNEPDAYSRHALREAPWTFVQYEEQARAYLSAIAAVAPGIPLAGPDVSGSAVFLGWGGGEATQLKPGLLTGHHYPLGCHDATAPTVERLLSLDTRRAEDISLDRYMRVARPARISFRLDETNSVSCGGRAGVSDTFGSALWAVSYIARSMAAGVAGINFHGDPGNCLGYAPLCAPTTARLATGALSVRPEWYALLLARALIGDRAVRTRLTWTRPPGQRPNVNVTVLRATDGRLHMVVVDDDPPGSARVLLHLHVPRRYRVARVLALTAPSPFASTGVRLGGRSVHADGSWVEPRSLPNAARHGKLIAVPVSPSSALLLTLR